MEVGYRECILKIQQSNFKETTLDTTFMLKYLINIVIFNKNSDHRDIAQLWVSYYAICYKQKQKYSL